MTMRKKDFPCLECLWTLLASIPLLLASCRPAGGEAVIRLTDETLMHEVRATPMPLDGSEAAVNPPRFMWQDKFPHLGAVLDGVAGEEDVKPEVLYRIRISRDRQFRHGVIEGELPWAFFNPFHCLEPGEWYWQHAYVAPDGKEEWSETLSFRVTEETPRFNPPSLEKVLAGLPASHPRILLDPAQWDDIRARNRENPEAQSYIERATRCLRHPLRHIREEIDTTNVVTLENIVQRQSALIRESRKIVDREEANVEALVRAYLLTRDERFCREGIGRLREVLSWQQSPYFAGDFNLSTLLSMSTSAYDGLYPNLSADERRLLLDTIRRLGSEFYHEYVNHLENRIADNHVWQMTFRILTMAAFATVGELPEASVWADYCYNEWVSRLPGLGGDGAWHNGDAYFHVNIRTLIEVPLLFSRLSGFDFFADPWYRNNVLYVIYQQPPFSKSGGHGNSHENQRSPTGARVGYADALARQLQDPWAAAYVEEILAEDPGILQGSFEAKPADLTWYRCTTPLKRPAATRRLSGLPPCKVFPETGTALMHTDLGHHGRNAMLSFRSSPYGATSHALANQNAFNTFWGGHAVFYSSGHRTGFTDDHCMYAYRNTRAHNSILADGMGQKIGTEGYGWIPRYYEGGTGGELSYVVGDASHAYGKVTSPLWIERGRLSGTEYTPEKGWDENKVELFRRHIVRLGRSGLFVVFDELEASAPVRWDYLLHTVELPMEFAPAAAGTDSAWVVRGANRQGGVSTAHLFASQPLQVAQTDTFFTPAVDWKKRLDNILPNHYHLRASTKPCRQACFLALIDVHGPERADLPVERIAPDALRVEGWKVAWGLDARGRARLSVSHPSTGVSLRFGYGKECRGATLLQDLDASGKLVERRLVDVLPQPEI